MHLIDQKRQLSMESLWVVEKQYEMLVKMLMRSIMRIAVHRLTLHYLAKV